MHGRRIENFEEAAALISFQQATLTLKLRKELVNIYIWKVLFYLDTQGYGKSCGVTEEYCRFTENTKPVTKKFCEEWESRQL